MCSSTELQNLIDAIKGPAPNNAVLGNNVVASLGLEERFGGCAPLNGLSDAVVLAEAVFPGECWELRKHDSHPHYENWHYNASLGGNQCEAVRTGADRPEKALTLAVLYLKLQLLLQRPRRAWLERVKLTSFRGNRNYSASEAARPCRSAR